MPYEKQNFVDGEVLPAEQLNHMEQGISDAMEKAETGGGGVYVGSGEMPDNCNVQIDPDGDVLTLGDIVDSVLAALPNGDAEGVTLIDRANGKAYTVYVSDGKLMMEESEG